MYITNVVLYIADSKRRWGQGHPQAVPPKHHDRNAE